jgi:Rad3-related DNA helicase
LGIIDNCTHDHSNVLKNVNRYTLYIQSLKFILPGLTEFPNNYVITNQESNKFTIAPWRTSWFTKKILEKFNLCIFMSATINRTIISKETGISEDTFEFIDQASEIPEENRQIKFLNSYSYKDESDWNVVIEKIKEIFSKHSKQRGLILCTQYKQKQEILERFEAKFPDDYKRLTDDSQGRKLKDTILENEKKENGVIVSAKAGTGIDLKGDSSRFQIIIKAPYLSEIADRNNIRAQKIQQVDPQRYWIKSMFRLVQFAGRSVRGIDDYAETYVLDDSAKKMIINNKTHVPNWFLNACKLDAKLN